MAQNIIELTAAIKDVSTVGIPALASMSLLIAFLVFACQLPKIMAKQNVLIANNTVVTESVSRSMDNLSTVLQTMNTEFKVHHQQTNEIRQDITSLQDDVSEIKQTTAVLNSKVDTMCK